MRFRISNCTLIGLAVFAVISWCIWGEGYFMSCALSPDGVSYLRMSEAAAHGHLFNPNGVSGHEGWFARWPLGYPWCIALVMKMTSLDAFTSARVLATLLAGGFIVLLARCARPAFPVLALSLLNLSFLGVFRLSYSEQPFLLAVLALCLVLSRERGKSMFFLVAAISGLSVAAFLFRYIGVFAIFWAMATSCMAARIARRNWRMVRVFAVAAIVVGAFVCGYLLLNRLMSGAFTGGHPPGMSESALVLVKRMAIALLNEMQAFAFAVIWPAALFFASGPGVFGKGGNTEDECVPDGMVFILFGLMCNGTVILLRFLMPFDALGFRLLCPGTTLLVLGVVLKVRACLRVDWATSINAVPTRRILVFLALLAVPAFHFLSMERELRRVMHLPMESWHEGYHAVRAHVMEKYADVPSGTRFAFPDKHPGVYYWIDFLRPDILADVPDSPDKGF